MKKNFSLLSSVHRPDRVAESIKAELNKYIARERRKALPEGVDFWDFDCNCGLDQGLAVIIHVTEFGRNIDKAAAEKAENIYVEILAKPGVRTKKPGATEAD